MASVARIDSGASPISRSSRTSAAEIAGVASAGLTRARHYGNGRLGRHEFIVIDTGGGVIERPENIEALQKKGINPVDSVALFV